MSLLEDVEKTLGVIAPGIATALGGPVAGLAVQAIAAAFGLPAGTDKAAAMQAVAGATPDQLLALKKADQDFQVRMKELDIDIYKTDAGDRDSARKREQAVGGFATPILASVVVGGFFGLVAYIVVNKGLGITGDAAALVGGLIGYASAKADQVVSYYFGSSQSSANKNILLAQAPAISSR